MAVRAISADEYESFLRGSEYVVLLFDASWNIATKEKFRPRFEAASETYSDRVVFGEIDCDDAVELARSIPIGNLPTVACTRRGAGRLPGCGLAHPGFDGRRADRPRYKGVGLFDGGPPSQGSD